MACRKGCGNDAAKIELIVKDLIRQMIEAGQLQEGIVDCTGARIWREGRVVTCDIVRDVICQLSEDGDLCLVVPERVIITEDKKIQILMSDGSTLTSGKLPSGSKLQSGSITGTTLTLTDTDSGRITVDFADLVAKYVVTAEQTSDGITLKQNNKIITTIPVHTATTRLQDMFGDDIGYIHKTVNGG